MGHLQNLFEYLELIPSLQKGVIVHVHDIFTPCDYPEHWFRSHVRFWNEQYLLETLMTNNKKYQVIAPLFFLSKKHFSRLKKYCPYLSNKSMPSSFYIKKLN